MTRRSTSEKDQRGPAAPTWVRSSQAVKNPAAAPEAAKGSSGGTSLRRRYPRRHQRTISTATGNVAATDLESRARTNAVKAQAQEPRERVGPRAAASLGSGSINAGRR